VVLSLLVPLCGPDLGWVGIPCGWGLSQHPPPVTCGVAFQSQPPWKPMLVSLDLQHLVSLRLLLQSNTSICGRASGLRDVLCQAVIASQVTPPVSSRDTEHSPQIPATSAPGRWPQISAAPVDCPQKTSFPEKFHHCACPRSATTGNSLLTHPTGSPGKVTCPQRPPAGPTLTLAFMMVHCRELWSWS
jgi:hypothetical protein